MGRRKAKKVGNGALNAQRIRLISEVAELERRASRLRAWVPPMERACEGVLDALDRTEDLLRAAKSGRVNEVIDANAHKKPAGEWAIKDAYLTMRDAANRFTSTLTAGLEGGGGGR